MGSPGHLISPLSQQLSGLSKGFGSVYLRAQHLPGTLCAHGHVALLRTGQAQVWSTQWTPDIGKGRWHQLYPFQSVRLQREPKLKLTQCPPSTHPHLLQAWLPPCSCLFLRPGKEDRIAASTSALSSSSPHLTQGFLQMGSSVSFQASLPNCPPSSYPGEGVISRGAGLFLQTGGLKSRAEGSHKASQGKMLN